MTDSTETTGQLDTSPFAVEERVWTTADAGSTDWVPEARIYVQWGASGVIVERHKGHGENYTVRHKNGKQACYERRELVRDPVPARRMAGDVPKKPGWYLARYQQRQSLGPVYLDDEGDVLVVETDGDAYYVDTLGITEWGPCIDALQAEADRLRAVLRKVRDGLMDLAEYDDIRAMQQAIDAELGDHA